ncbi:hypothetical protein BUALT_Bualt07G0126300 [Buddleja alternifolia]|uniref:Uncharacterized protein n=1 Tax=Buddleja alternifolia TaxID=168488 RepID=A0AAV6XKZ7_9LAMI|nr:hypothetical protein BUALT_Bualt07G0126300 [Buddleja alternifolia]
MIVMTRAIGPSKYANPAYWLKVFDPKTAYQLTHFEPEMCVWGELPPILEYSDGLPMFCQLVAVGLNLVVMGGLNPMTYEVSNDVFIYDFVIDAWRRGASMPGATSQKEYSVMASSMSSVDTAQVGIVDSIETSDESFDVATWQWGSVQEDFLNSTMTAARQGKVYIIQPKLYCAPYKDFPLNFKLDSKWDKVLMKKMASQALFN